MHLAYVKVPTHRLLNLDISVSVLILLLGWDSVVQTSGTVSCIVAYLRNPQGTGAYNTTYKRLTSHGKAAGDFSMPDVTREVSVGKWIWPLLARWIWVRVCHAPIVLNRDLKAGLEACGPIHCFQMLLEHGEVCTQRAPFISQTETSLIQMLSFLTFCCRCNLASLEQPVGSCSFYLAGTCVTGISLPKISWRLIFLLNCHLLKVHSTTFSLRAWCPPRWEHVSPYGDTLSGSLPQSCLCNRLAEFLIICNFLSHCFDMGDSSKALFIKFLHPWRYLECVLCCIHKQVEIAATIAGLWSSVWQYPGSRDRVEPGRRWKLAFP